MSHHGANPFEDPNSPAFQDRQRLLREMLNTASFRGALGDFPAGQLTKSDEGAIQFAIGDKDGKVVIEFGTPVAWLGMTPQEAADFATALLKRARLAARKAGQSVAFTIG